MAGDRRVFVITEAGDTGPFPVGELRELLQLGKIRLEHRVRTSSGRDLGDLGYVLANPTKINIQPSDRRARIRARRRRAGGNLVLIVTVLVVGALATWLAFH